MPSLLRRCTADLPPMAPPSLFSLFALLALLAGCDSNINNGWKLRARSSVVFTYEERTYQPQQDTFYPQEIGFIRAGKAGTFVVLGDTVELICKENPPLVDQAALLEIDSSGIAAITVAPNPTVSDNITPEEAFEIRRILD